MSGLQLPGRLFAVFLLLVLSTAGCIVVLRHNCSLSLFVCEGWGHPVKPLA